MINYTLPQIPPILQQETSQQSQNVRFFYKFTFLSQASDRVHNGYELFSKRNALGAEVSWHLQHASKTPGSPPNQDLFGTWKYWLIRELDGHSQVQIYFASIHSEQILILSFISTILKHRGKQLRLYQNFFNSTEEMCQHHCEVVTSILLKQIFFLAEM